MKKLLVVGIAAAAFCGAPALAADIPTKAPIVKAPAIVPFSWTGFYVGGNVGAVSEHASGTSAFLDTLDPGVTNAQSNSFSDTRFLGGVQVGYNWQFNPHWVLGVEADWDWTNSTYNFCRKTDVDSTACTDNGRGFETISSKTKWLATARGRLGVVWDRWMVYGTGGAAWGSIDTNLALNCSGGGCGISSSPLSAASTTNTTKAGWVAGLGVEAMLASNWTARAEWLHIDLGTISASLPTTGSIGSTQTASWSRTGRFDEFRVGINYLFR
jgi:outer membrane immunogenic protein